MSSQKHHHLLDATERLLRSEKGANFTLEDLAAETNLSRATLYRRIGSKEALLKRLAEERGLEISDLDRPDTHTRILQAARVVFGQYGLAAATLEQVAQAADVGIATIYRRFGDKKGLIQAFADEYTPQRIIYKLTEQPNGSLEDELRQIALQMLHFLVENRDMIRLGFGNDDEYEQISGRFRNAPERTLNRLTSYFTAKINSGIIAAQDPQQLALTFSGMLLAFGFLGPVYYRLPTTEPEAAATFIVETFLQGVRK